MNPTIAPVGTPTGNEAWCTAGGPLMCGGADLALSPRTQPRYPVESLHMNDDVMNNINIHAKAAAWGQPLLPLIRTNRNFTRCATVPGPKPAGGQFLLLGGGPAKPPSIPSTPAADRTAVACPTIGTKEQPTSMLLRDDEAIDTDLDEMVELSFILTSDASISFCVPSVVVGQSSASPSTQCLAPTPTPGTTTAILDVETADDDHSFLFSEPREVGSHGALATSRVAVECAHRRSLHLPTFLNVEKPYKEATLGKRRRRFMNMTPTR